MSFIEKGRRISMDRTNIYSNEYYSHVRINVNSLKVVALLAYFIFRWRTDIYYSRDSFRKQKIDDVDPELKLDYWLRNSIAKILTLW